MYRNFPIYSSSSFSLFFFIIHYFLCCRSHSSSSANLPLSFRLCSVVWDFFFLFCSCFFFTLVHYLFVAAIFRRPTNGLKKPILVWFSFANTVSIYAWKIFHCGSGKTFLPPRKRALFLFTSFGECYYHIPNIVGVSCFGIRYCRCICVGEFMCTWHRTTFQLQGRNFSLLFHSFSILASAFFFFMYIFFGTYF